MTTAVKSRLGRLEAVGRTLEPPIRSLAVAVLAGISAGVIVGGIGSRIAMRISAIAAGDRFQGVETEAEATVGEITFDGSVGLIIFGGAFVGMFGGLIYLAARRWVADTGRWKGLAFGLLLLAMFGWAIIEGDNRDFHLFGPPALNIAMFASLFVFFGLLVAPLFDRVDGWLPASLFKSDPAGDSTAPEPRRKRWREDPVVIAALLLTVFPVGLWLLARRGGRRRPRTVRALTAYGFGLFAAVMITALIVVGFGEEEGDNTVFFTIMPAYVLLALPAAGLLLARATGRFERLSDLREHWGAMAAALAVLALPVVVGFVLDVQAVVDIFEANR